jgi:Secretory lipase
MLVTGRTLAGHGVCVAYVELNVWVEFSTGCEPCPSQSGSVWSHSQGGQAALFTGLIAKSYAPELDLLGFAAAAPATDLVTLMNDDIDSVGGKNITAMTLCTENPYGCF